ncbi:MAG: RluA family pseudouridine synthase [Chitinophagaceae bacterium]
MLECLYEDDYLMVVHKPAGIAVQSVTELEAFIQKGWQPVHRLDQRVSGLILFAKNAVAISKLQQAFADRKVTKIYKAIVAVAPPENEETLTHFLLKNATLKKAIVYNKEIAHSKKAVLYYQLIQSSLKYHLLDVHLYTGRFHQIRAQLAAIGSPIVGDVKYGYKRTNADASIFLQSNALAFQHPISNELLQFNLPLPALWKKYGFE